MGMWEFPDLSLNRDKMFSIPKKKKHKNYWFLFSYKINVSTLTRVKLLNMIHVPRMGYQHCTGVSNCMRFFFPECYGIYLILAIQSLF